MMTILDVFYQGEDLQDIQHLELDASSTFAKFKKLICEKYGISDDIHVFLEDSEDPVDDHNCMSDFGDKSGLKLHFHRRHRIEVCVSFNGEEVSRRFSPSATISRVKRWAAQRKLDMTKEEAGEHLLQISGSHDRPHPGTHIGTLSNGHCTKLEFDLVPDQRINGHRGLQA